MGVQQVLVLAWDLLCLLSNCEWDSNFCLVFPIFAHVFGRSGERRLLLSLHVRKFQFKQEQDSENPISHIQKIVSGEDPVYTVC